MIKNITSVLVGESLKNSPGHISVKYFFQRIISFLQILNIVFMIFVVIFGIGINAVFLTVLQTKVKTTTCKKIYLIVMKMSKGKFCHIGFSLLNTNNFLMFDEI